MKITAIYRDSAKTHANPEQTATTHTAETLAPIKKHTHIRMKKIIKYIIYFILLNIALIIGYMSIINHSVLVDTELLIKAFGLLFVVVFVLANKILADHSPFHDIITITDEYDIQISKTEIENLIFKSTINAGKILIIFGLYNLLLLLINLFVFKHISASSLIFSGLLIWPIYGRFQISREIKGSIYSTEKIKMIIKNDMIELITNQIHQKIKVKDLEFEYKTSKWILFKRLKHDDYIILKNKQITGANKTV